MKTIISAATALRDYFLPGGLRVYLLSLIPGGLYRVTPSMIRLWQPIGTVEIPRSQIAAVKPRHISHVVVRLYSGQRFVLNLFFLGNRSDVVLVALRESIVTNHVRRAMGHGEGRGGSN